MTNSFTCIFSSSLDPFPSARAALQGQGMSHHGNVCSSDGEQIGGVENDAAAVAAACEIISC